MAYYIVYKHIFLSILLNSLIGFVSSQHFKHTNNTSTLAPNWENVTQNNTSTEPSKVKITVYYETLCPASVEFFTAQLRPVMEKLASHVDVHLVPYGHAKTSQVRGRFRFSCQHGPAECFGNKLHACAVDALQNDTQAVLFNACLMEYAANRASTGFEYVSALNWCGYKLDVFIHGVWQCVNSERGSVLLKGYGDETRALRPKYVPHVLLDGSADTQHEATGNLLSTVCRKLPDSTRACYGYV